MPSRILHDIIVHFLDTSEARHIEHNEPIRMFGQDSFYQQYMQRPQELLTLRRTVRESEIYDLPVNVYQELLNVLQSWCTSGDAIDVSRRFKGVYLTHIERSMNTESFGMDFHLEFKVTNPNFDAVEQTRQRYTAQPRRSAVMNMDTAGGLHPEYFGEYQPRKKDNLIKKVEKHFDEDLFNV